MPTLAKPELIERESPWLEEFDRFYQELCLNKVRILESLGYYEENDLPVPKLDQAGELSEEEEEEEIKPIARALTVAAGASQVLPGAKLLATLKRVSKDPACWQQGRFPEEVELAIARTYQRGDENPGTHWYDVWRGKLAFPEEQIEVPTDLNIAKAALAAIAPFEARNRAADRLISQTKLSPTSWAQSFAGAASRLFANVSQSNAMVRRPTLRADPSMSFSVWSCRPCKPIFRNGNFLLSQSIPLCGLRPRDI
jgi:hypothetical protein